MTLIAPGEQIIAQPWDEHLDWMRANWEPGQHMANIGPTGEGKTTYMVGLLSIRKWVVALDPKGEDNTLSKSGFIRVRSVPPAGTAAKARYRLTADGRAWEQIWQAIDAGRPARVIIGGSARSADQVSALRKLMAEAIAYIRYCTGWTVYVDEFEVLASPQMFGLGGPVSEMLNMARAAGTSVVCSFQAPAWVPSHATRQARFGIMYPTGDTDMIDKVARAFGRDRRMLREAVAELPRYFALVIPRGKTSGPVILVNAPKVG